MLHNRTEMDCQRSAGDSSECDCSKPDGAVRNFGILKQSGSSDTVKKVSKIKKNQIPNEILENDSLRKAIKLLPSNYNFEIPKCVWRILSSKAKCVALQFPEGLLIYACIIADIFEKFCNTSTIILGDVTYGACCIDDFTASKLGADFLIHYGHSCLVPVSSSLIPVMYVFVEISFDHTHLVNCICKNFATTTSIALMGTIQFVNMLHAVRTELLSKHNFQDISIPQATPLSMGETLGCTSPKITSETLVFVADGRFHLESAMIMNPTVQSFRYDPYSMIITREGYDIDLMKRVRKQNIEKASNATVFGLILGTLGRQGSVNIYQRLLTLLEERQKTVVQFLMAEINPLKLASMSSVQVWVQVACPRLSIDWGAEFHCPILTPYEVEVSLGACDWQEVYPMDYYSSKPRVWGPAK